MNTLKLTREPLDVGRICEMAKSTSCGDISIFVGTTPDYIERKKLIALEYEAIEQMALKQLELICKELRNRWQDIVNIVIYHRLGLVGIGQVSCVIAISSPNSETSLNAVTVAVNDFKKRMPINQRGKFNSEQSSEENKKCEVLNNNDIKLFNETMCSLEYSPPNLNQLTQISVSEEEMQRRIQCFIEKKRNEIDLCNIMDFTDIKPKRKLNEANEEQEEDTESESMTCARVNKCHLNVRKVKNRSGPQTRQNYLDTLDKLMVPSKKENEESHFVEHEKKSRPTSSHSDMVKHSTNMERLKHIEDHILITAGLNNIQQRLKVIEDRLINLESTSPEYSHFLDEKCYNKKSSIPNETHHYERKTYSANQIDAIIQKLKEKNIDNQDSNMT